MAVFYLEHITQGGLKGDEKVEIAKKRLAYSLTMMGKSEMSKNNYESARQYFEKSLSEEPRSAETLMYLGMCYSNMGKKEEARLHVSRAIEMDPGYVPARDLIKLLN